MVSWTHGRTCCRIWWTSSTEPVICRTDHHGVNRMAIYQIRIKEHLDPRWSVWFDGLTVTPTEHAETVLIGPLVDQAALYGLLIKVRDLGLELLSVNQVRSESDAAVSGEM